MHKLLNIFTEAPEKVDFFTKSLEWIKANPVLTGLLAATAIVLVAVLVLSVKVSKKQNKKKK